MTAITALLLLTFSFLNQVVAVGSCSSLFASEARVYERYDPNNMDQIIKALIEDGEYKKIRSANPKKTNLPFFDDYINDTIVRLEREKINLGESRVTKEIESIILDAKLRMKTKKVTYNWVWEFSYQVLTVFEVKYNKPTFKNFENILNLFPQEIMIPTFAEQEFKHFIEMEGYGVTFLGMREVEQFVDGNEVPFSPEQFLNHDFLHYNLTMKGDHLLSLRDKNYYGWLKLHSKIKYQISLLKEPQKKDVQFIYFYLLHEEFAIRDRMTYRFLDPKIGKMSEYITTALAYDLIKNHFDALAYPSKIFKPELYTRATRPYDFREAFPNQNPHEVLLEGISGFIKIINNIESGPNIKQRVKKLFFPF